MFPFDPRTTQFPRTWKEMSLEYKLIAVYHICMMVLFLLGGLLSITSELSITGILVLILISLSIRHRRQTGWRWPGVRPQQAAFSLAAIVLGGFFLSQPRRSFRRLARSRFHGISAVAALSPSGCCSAFV